MSRRLVVDGQIFQTPAWHRGMGKYSLELLTALLKPKTNKWETVDLILSSRIKLEKSAEQAIAAKLPKVNVVKLNLAPNDFRDKRLIEKNRRVIDGFINEKYEDPGKVDFLVASMIQGEILPAFPTDNRIQKLVLFYDLVPLMFQNIYLHSPVTKAEYLSKFAELFKADKYFTISKTVANDLALYLGIDKSRIVNIDGGPIDHSSASKPVDIPKPFILMPTGNDPRKNNRLGVLGFNEFNKLQSGRYNLAITSFFNPKERQELSKLAKNVHFTGNISGEELKYLYEEAEAILFPSEYEGLGLPILEAIEDNKPVACSNISVFREMSERAFYYFEPKSVLGIERALTDAITGDKIDKIAYKSILDKYKWSNTAKQLSETIASLPPKPPKPTVHRLAVFGPNPATGGNSGNLMQNSHAELSREFEVSYFLAGKTPKKVRRANYLPYVTNAQTITDGVAFTPADYQDVVYHLANIPQCAEVLLTALAVPGLVILHDMNLDVVWQELLEKNLIARTRYDLEVDINKRYKATGTSFIGSLLQGQHRIVVFNPVHKSQLEKLTKQLSSETVVQVAQLPVGNLVYPEAIPNKTINIGELYEHQLASDHRKIDTRTDAKYNEAISKMKTVIFDNSSSTFDVAWALRFGVVPFTKTTNILDTTDKLIVHQYDDVSKAKQTAQKLIADGTKYHQTVQHIAEYAEAHSMAKYQALVKTAAGAPK